MTIIIFTENLTPEQCQRRDKMLKAASLDEDIISEKGIWRFENEREKKK